MSDVMRGIALIGGGTLVYIVSELVRSLERADEARVEKAAHRSGR